MANTTYPTTPKRKPGAPGDDPRAQEPREQKVAGREPTQADRNRRADADKPTREGDVLGISDAKAPIPKAPRRKGGHPDGIEVGDSERPGARDVTRGQHHGATSIDMGGGGEGTKVKP